MRTNSCDVKICNSVSEAPDYVNEHSEYRIAELHMAIIVRNGTKNGNDTVDLIFQDGAGNKYVALVTANILKSIVSLTITNRN